MTFQEYQDKAKKTACYPGNMMILYPTLGLAGEAGEVCEKIKKVYRDKGGDFTCLSKEDIKKELGDVLWYVQQLCNDLNIKLEEVAQMNIDKLYSRMERNMIKGDGDNR